MSKLEPFNMELMGVDATKVRNLRPVTTLDLYEGATSNLHPNGLFSIETFGRKGDILRDVSFSYIDLKMDIFNPTYFENLIKLKALYKGIISGVDYAVWDKKEKDFVKSNELEGETGFHFFLEHWKDIKHKQTGSLERKDRIALIEKYKDVALGSRVLVMPAGLRDIEQDEQGNTKKDEINDFYTRLLSIANTVVKDNKDASMNNHRVSAQNTFYELHLHIKGIIYGKNGFMADKFAKRNVVNGTRNVLVSMDSAVDDIKSPRTQHFNDTGVGVFQTAKGVLPLFKYFLRDKISTVFNSVDGLASVIDAKTWNSKLKALNTDTVNRWMSSEGIEKLINLFFNREMRHQPIMLDNDYLALIYNDGKNFKMFWDIKDLPDNRDKKHVQPITYMELIYLVVKDIVPNVRGWVTRYPIGQGKRSMYPTTFYLHSTTTTISLIGLDDNWEVDNNDLALEFPIRGETFMDGMIPHSSRIEGLVADFDGDTGSVEYIIAEDAVEEIDDILNSARHYMNPNGGLIYNSANNITELVLHNLTGEPNA